MNIDKENMNTVSIIGLGWLGLPLAHHLKTQGWKITGTKRTTLAVQQIQEEEGIDCIQLDLSLSYIPSEILNSQRMIINIPPSRSEDNYVEGIKRLVSLGILQNLKHVIFVSSTSVFPNIQGMFDEESQTEITSPTTQKLIEVEQWLLTLDIHCDILRLGGLIGKNRHPIHYLSGKSNLSGANQPVNLVHLNDCILAIQLLLETPQKQRIYHLCSPLHPTRAEYYGEIAKQLQLPPPHFLPDNQPMKRVIAANKICQQLGFDYQYADIFKI